MLSDLFRGLMMLLGIIALVSYLSGHDVNATVGNSVNAVLPIFGYLWSQVVNLIQSGI
ncbi:hypothetical protein AB4571_02325 [Vibrio breoganii]|uniref:hypothetical protein n=1 Tax=Vibrio breoganii TaxID=553239 RepID=UPI0012FFFB9E|nr:hypothetical protein [Vibrio breoganii]